MLYENPIYKYHQSTLQRAGEGGGILLVSQYHVERRTPSKVPRKTSFTSLEVGSWSRMVCSPFCKYRELNSSCHTERNCCSLVKTNCVVPGGPHSHIKTANFRGWS